MSNGNALMREIMSEYDIKCASRDLLLQFDTESRRLGHDRAEFGPRWWRLVKSEVYLLLCTDDPKYATERKRMSVSAKPAIATLAAFLVHAIGLEKGLATSYAALSLLVPLKITKNAWCEALSKEGMSTHTLEHDTLRQLNEDMTETE